MIGVGGMGMTPLAVYLSRSGYDVCGYDDELCEPVRRILDNEGVTFSKDGNLPDGYDLVVHSAAVSSSHPCMRQAIKAGLPVLSRSEMLAKQAEGRKLLAVVGSHGKTTTAAMIAHILQGQGYPAGFIGGGLFNDDSLPPAWNSRGKWLVAEIDESDGSIEHFSPDITLLTNLDWDHPDQYTNEEDLLNAFGRLFRRTKQCILAPFSQIEKLMDLLPGENGPKTCFFGEQGDYSGKFSNENGRSAEIVLQGLFRKRAERIQARGEFNMNNALAAMAACHSMGFREVEGGLKDYKGVQRRQSLLFDSDKLSVIADYAHHPTEISALMTAAKKWFPNRSVTVVFQPHRYSRTAQFREAFAQELGEADRLLILPVYGAGEKPRDDGSSEALRKLMDGKPEFLYWLPGRGRLKRLHSSLKKPSVVLFIGAGTVDKTARLFSAICRCKSNPGREWMEYLKPNVTPDSRLRLDETLHNKTTLKIGGKAKFYAEPGTLEDLLQIQESAALFGMPHYILGRGSNLIVPKQGFPGVVLRLNRPYWRNVERIGGGRIRVGSGVRLVEVANQTCAMGLSGFEFMEGIPGAIGGALRMNAGAMGSWILDLVEEISVMDAQGKLETLRKKDFLAGYRRCQGLNGRMVLTAVLKSPRSDDSERIRSRMLSFAKRRRATQPRESSAGCVFRNPEGYYAGQLIEEAGLKGERVRSAEVSRVHGNFIVNLGNARYGDVIELVRLVRKQVRKAFNLELVPEVELLGLNWETEL